MTINQTIVIGILMPFLGTTMGAAMVFCLKNKISTVLHKILFGFAAGVMVAASVWSLLLPSIEMSITQGLIAWLPPSIGFFSGIVALLIIDEGIRKMEQQKHHDHTSVWMMFLAITLHNVPEGMAVGVILASLLSQNIGVSIASALSLSMGIAIQNIPEGGIVSLPLKSEGKTKTCSFFYGVLSGIVEPIAAITTILLTGMMTSILTYLLAFAAGAMIYVVAIELIPQMVEGKGKQLGMIFLGIGFVIMMILDVALG